jgi:hypothetical protein
VKTLSLLKISHSATKILLFPWMCCADFPLFNERNFEVASGNFYAVDGYFYHSKIC